MALNPPMHSARVPVPIPGETFLLERGGITFELEPKNKKEKKVKVKGSLLLTTVRITIIGKSKDKKINAVDIPIQKISGEKFEQPAFKANRLTGTVAPLPPIPSNFSRRLESPCDFSITFKDGGVSCFLKFFFYLMDQYRRADIRSREASLSSANIQQWVSTQGVAFVDPSDPSKIYVAPQPQVEYTQDHYNVANAYRYSNPPATGMDPYNPHQQHHAQHHHPQHHVQPQHHYPAPVPHAHPQPYPVQHYPQQYPAQQYHQPHQQPYQHQHYPAHVQHPPQQYPPQQYTHQHYPQQHYPQQHHPQQYYPQAQYPPQHYAPAAQAPPQQQPSSSAAAAPSPYQYPAAVPDSAYDPVQKPTKSVP